MVSPGSDESRPRIVVRMARAISSSSRERNESFWYKMLAKAKTGDMNSIAEFAIDVERVPPTMIYDVLIVLFDNLKGCTGPDGLIQSDVALLMQQCIFTVGIIGHELEVTPVGSNPRLRAPFEGHLTRSAFLSILSRNWKYVIKWMKHLWHRQEYTYFPSRSQVNYSKRIRLRSRFACAQMFQLIVENEEFLASISSSDSAVKVIVTMWLEWEAPPPDGVDLNMPGLGYIPLMVMSKYLWQSLSVKNEHRKQFIEKAISCVRGDETSVVRKLVERIRRTMLAPDTAKSPLTYEEIKLHLSILARFMLDTMADNTISKEFYNQDGTTFLVECLLELSTWTSDVQSQFLGTLQDILFMVQVAYLSASRLRMVNNKRLVEALRSGLLEALVNLAPHLQSFGEERCANLAKEHLMLITMHTQNVSVVSCLAKAFSALDADQGPAIEQLSRTCLRTDWARVRKVVLERLVYLRVHKHSVNAGLREGLCHGCNLLFPNKKLRNCAACKGVQYCSRHCQVAAWSVHKYCCAEVGKEIIRMKEAQSFSKRDAAFIQMLAARQIRRHIPGLKALPKLKYPDVPPNQIVYVINYALIPQELSVIPAVDFFRDKSPHYTSSFVERATRGNGNIIVMAAHIYNDGHSPCTFTMNVDLGRYADGIGLRRPNVPDLGSELELLPLTVTDGNFVRNCWDEFDNIAHAVALKMREELKDKNGPKRTIWDWVKKCARPGKYADDMNW